MSWIHRWGTRGYWGQLCMYIKISYYSLKCIHFLFKQQQSKRHNITLVMASVGKKVPPLLGRDLLRISFFYLVLFSFCASGSCVKPLHTESLCNNQSANTYWKPIGQQLLFASEGKTPGGLAWGFGLGWGNLICTWTPWEQECILQRPHW